MTTNQAPSYHKWILNQAILVLAGIPLLFISSTQVLYPGLLLGHLLLLTVQSGRTQWQTVGRCLANGTTLIRSLLFFMASFLWTCLSQPQIAILFLSAALLDGLDGWLARRFQGQSALGIVFDEEVDALYILMVTMVIWRSGLTGPWIMAAGWIRSVVLLMRTYLPPSKPTHSRTFSWARILAGLVFILFPAGILIDGWVGHLLIILAFGLVLLSFTVEMILYYGR